MEQVIGQVTGAINSASETSDPQAIWGALYILTLLKGRPRGLAEAAYRWCATIWENRCRYQDWETLLLLSLEVGFRHIRSSYPQFLPPSAHAEHHRGVFNTVLESNDSEAIADLVWASFMVDKSCRLGLSVCADYIIDFCSGTTEPFPQTVQKLFLHCVAVTGFDALEDVGKERFVKLLNRLHIGIGDIVISSGRTWTEILLEIIQSTERAGHLAVQSWELLAELAIFHFPPYATYNPDVTTPLVCAEEWDKLECWMGVVWMAWPPDPGNVAKDLEDAMGLLEKERPGAVRKRMEQWSEKLCEDVPESFQQTCDKLAL